MFTIDVENLLVFRELGQSQADLFVRRPVRTSHHDHFAWRGLSRIESNHWEGCFACYSGVDFNSGVRVCGCGLWIWEFWWGEDGGLRQSVLSAVTQGRIAAGAHYTQAGGNCQAGNQNSYPQ